MVAYGYILPKKNQNTRAETLQLGLKNQNVKNLNAKINLSMYKPLTITSNVPTITEQTGQPQQMPPTGFSPLPPKGDETRQATIPAPTKIDEIRPAEALQELYQLSGVKEDEIRMPNFVAGSDITKSIESIIDKLIKKRYETFGKVANQILEQQERLKQVKNKNKLMKELLEKNNIKNAIDRNDRLLQQARDYLKQLYDEYNYPEYDRYDVDNTDLYTINREIADIYNYYDTSDFDDEMPMLESPTPSTILEKPPVSTASTVGTINTWTSSQDENFNKLSPDAQRVILFTEEFKNPNLTFDQFKNIINSFKGKVILNLQGDKRKDVNLRVPISDKKIQTTNIKDTGLKKAYDYYSKNPQSYYETLTNANRSEFSVLYAGRLRGGAVKSPYYSSYAPNFGNLYLKEDSLKRNQLTIYKPYSKVSVASKSSITPLLKKMIFDIQNTLEFDERDYQNLEADEKRVIERIIRGQKNMKNYNIQALIDTDDLKAKKRLEILVGQINAGNNSSLIRQEMKPLLKRLYDNKAISMWKYQNSLKAIKALE